MWRKNRYLLLTGVQTRKPVTTLTGLSKFKQHRRPRESTERATENTRYTNKLWKKKWRLTPRSYGNFSDVPVMQIVYSICNRRIFLLRMTWYKLTKLQLFGKRNTILIHATNYTIGNRTRNLPAYSAVPQPNAPPRAPSSIESEPKIFLHPSRLQASLNTLNYPKISLHPFTRQIGGNSFMR